MPTVAERLDYPPDAKLLILNCADLGLLPRGHRGRLRRPARRDRHQRLADRARPRGPGSRHPGSGATTSGCGSPSTPSTTSTAGDRSPRRPPSSTATAGSPARSPTCGTTPTSTRSAGSAGPRSSGPCCGASTSATSTPTSMPSSSGPSSSTSTSSWPSTSACPSACSSADAEPNVGFPVRTAGRRRGRAVRRPLRHPAAGRSPPGLRRLVAGLEPGVTEVTLHPAVDTPELRAIATDWAARVADHVLLVDDRGLGQSVAEAGVTLIGYRPLRDAMREC